MKTKYNSLESYRIETITPIFRFKRQFDIEITSETKWIGKQNYAQ